MGGCLRLSGTLSGFDNQWFFNKVNQAESLESDEA
jgi:hypothetical protein